MKKIAKIIIYLSLIISLLAGCNNKETSSKENRNQYESKETLHEEQDDDKDELIDGNTVETKKVNGEKAVVLAGNSDLKEYESLLSTIKNIAAERNMTVYILDINDEINQNWRDENDAVGDMNVVIMANGYKVVCNLESEEMYQKETLNRLVDTILSSLESM